MFTFRVPNIVYQNISTSHQMSNVSDTEMFQSDTESKRRLGPNIRTAEFLWKSALELQTNNNIGAALLPVIRQMRESSAFLKAKRVDTTSIFNPSDVCQFCGNPWVEGNYKLRIESHGNKMKRIKKKLLATPKENLSKYQKHLLALFKKYKDNTMVKICTVCGKRTRIGLNKPKSVVKKEEVHVDCNDSKNKKKKKKKTKDRFSGLFPSAVVSSRISMGSAANNSFSNVSCNSQISESTLAYEPTLKTDTNTKNIANLPESSNENTIMEQTDTSVLENENSVIDSEISIKNTSIASPSISFNMGDNTPLHNNKNKKKKKKKSSTLLNTSNKFDSGGNFNNSGNNVSNKFTGKPQIIKSQTPMKSGKITKPHKKSSIISDFLNFL